ncbi:UTP--glucose-1-phosphate uridylyltransferase GalU [Shewanella intestini]|uniref:UTP--glucose-1-phosphate uridylyltransferase n=1 Tax=Shewanella intestini TaxID=2017544 RepID=A0ABS5HZV9_9GAMM|nr:MULTISPECIES: UTP--glucose-1-phosphate uridylyltransferase GalU [Shewanella]MBR9727287.1 UTP--glucose-1-phosphate uridylyltransferase GalU [Shewanella intestini]MRG35662.1 UTP--glucose-1-phosphate uridylyltransferase GalU [Shewanella sp. XMDDZSB0408]
MKQHKITKAVIPVAGLGTRMLPATKTIPKEMLPIMDKPLIQYVVQEAIEAGIKEIVLVTHASKNAVENHFDTSFELEAHLEKRVKRQLLSEVKAICPADVSIISVRQAQAKGLGHAILCAKTVVGNAPFAVLLPDVILDSASSNLKTDNLAQMVTLFDQTEVGQIMVEGVPETQVDQYGIADINGKNLKPGESLPLTKLVEKPEIEEAPSNLGIVGRYILPAEIWSYLAKTPAGAGDEIQLTDAIAMLMENQTVNAYYMQGKSHDCGNKLGYMQAGVEHALRHKEIGKEFSDYIKTIAKTL